MGYANSMGAFGPTKQVDDVTSDSGRAAIPQRLSLIEPYRLAPRDHDGNSSVAGASPLHPPHLGHCLERFSDAIIANAQLTP